MRGQGTRKPGTAGRRADPARGRLSGWRTWGATLLLGLALVLGLGPAPAAAAQPEGGTVAQPIGRGA